MEIITGKTAESRRMIQFSRLSQAFSCLWKTRASGFALAALCLITALMLAPTKAIGAAPLTLAREQVLLLNDSLESLEDQSRTLKIEDILSPSFSTKFAPPNKRFTYFNLSKSVYWLRFKLKRPSDLLPESRAEAYCHPWYLELADPQLPRAELYIPVRRSPNETGTGSSLEYVVEKAGLSQTMADRRLLSSNPVLTVRADFVEDAPFFLRLEGMDYFEQPIYLWPHSKFQWRSWVGDLWFAVPYGLLIGVFFYNLFIYLSLREKIYGWYLCYVAALACSQLYQDSRTFILLGLNAREGAILEACLFGVVNLSVVTFTRYFLVPKINAPSMDKVFDLIAWMSLPVPILALFNHYDYADLVVSLTMVATTIAFFYTAICCLRKGFRPARFYLLASSFFLAAIFAQVVWWRGAVFSPNLMLIPPVLLGASLEALLFSFALSDRIRTINREKEMAQVALHESESFFRDVVGSITEGVVVADQSGRTTYVAPRAALMLDMLDGAADSNGESRGVGRLFESESKNGRTMQDKEEEVLSREVSIPGRDGVDHTFLVDSRTLSLDAGRRLFTFREITERRQLEQEVMEIGEHERRRIGQDLHDGHCQQLAGILFLCEALHMRLANRADEESPSVKRISDLLNEAIGQARSISRGLCPLNDDPAALPMALHELASSVCETFDVACKCSCHRKIAIHEKDTTLHLYRIAQEAVNNAIRHGHAANILMDVAVTPDEILMNIEDDGKGFDIDSVKTGGMGLKIMEYRARSIGAKLRINSSRSGGTKISCQLPKILPKPEGKPQ